MRVGFVELYLYKLGYQPRDISPLLMYIFIPAFFGDVIRFMWPAFNRLWMRVMGPLMRDREKQQWNGVIFYLLGAWTVLSFFPKVTNPFYILLPHGHCLFASFLLGQRLTCVVGHCDRVNSPSIMVRHRSVNIRPSLRKIRSLSPPRKIPHRVPCGNGDGSPRRVRLLGNSVSALRIACPGTPFLLVQTFYFRFQFYARGKCVVDEEYE